MVAKCTVTGWYYLKKSTIRVLDPFMEFHTPQRTFTEFGTSGAVRQLQLLLRYFTTTEMPRHSPSTAGATIFTALKKRANGSVLPVLVLTTERSRVHSTTTAPTTTVNTLDANTPAAARHSVSLLDSGFGG